MEYHFSCPNCGETLMAEVDVGEHIVDWDEVCESCGHIFSEKEVLDIYDRALEGALCSMIDSAHDLYEDR